MDIKVDDFLKTNLAKNGPNKIFGEDVDNRKRNMNDIALIQRFDQVWENELKNAVIQARPGVSLEISQKLNNNQKNYFDDKQEHREFRLVNNTIHFIAQLKHLSKQEYKLTQLWFIPSSDSHPETLYINFDTVEERQQFKRLAKKLGWNNDEKLGKELVRDFINKFPKSFYQEESSDKEI